MIRTLIFAIIVGTVGISLGPTLAHQNGAKLHLTEAPPDQQVDAITYWQAVYRVVTKEVTPIGYPEFDLHFNTDASEDGPVPGTTVVINASMKGDREFAVFAAPVEISAIIEIDQC